jgi:hypothetical protein
MAKGKGMRGSEDTGQAGAFQDCDADDMPNTADSQEGDIPVLARWCWQSVVLKTCVLMGSLG